MCFCSVMSNSYQLPGLWPTKLHGPWNFPGKNTKVGCHFLLQGIFPTRGSNPHVLHLLHWQANSLPLHCLESPKIYVFGSIFALKKKFTNLYPLMHQYEKKFTNLYPFMHHYDTDSWALTVCVISPKTSPPSELFFLTVFLALLECLFSISTLVAAMGP